MEKITKTKHFYIKSVSLKNRQIKVVYKRLNLINTLHGKLIKVRKTSIRIKLNSKEHYTHDIGFRNLIELTENENRKTD